MTTLAPMKDFATNAEDGRPSKSSGGIGNEFIASMIVLPFQFGRAFATSRCSPNGTAKMMVSASIASRSDSGDYRGSNRAGLRRQILGRPAARDSHADVFTGEGAGEGLAYLSESYDCVAHNVLQSVLKPRLAKRTLAMLLEQSIKSCAYSGAQAATAL